ncbi:MAG: hypothetical protein IKO32_13025 [Lachnospiraceae bacterium]|nr:hypothetical protein [Lachnospiraceae bacterium]
MKNKKNSGKFGGTKNLKPLNRFTPKQSPRKEKDHKTEELWAKILRHRTEIIIRIGIVVVVLLLATGFFYFSYLNKEYDSINVVKSTGSVVTMGSDVMRFGNCILVYSNDGMKCVNEKGDVVWNETFQMQNPMIDISGDVVGIADYNGSIIYMMNKTGKLGTINTGMPIRKFCVSAKGLAIAILDDSDITPIHIYDTSGNTVAYFSTSMRNSGYPIDIAITESGYVVAVSYLYVDNASYKTDVAFYNFGEVGQNQTDNLVSGYTYSNAIVPEVRFIDNANAVAVADNRLMFYTGDQKPVSSGEVLVEDEIAAVYYGEQYVALVFNNTGDGDRYRVNIYDRNGKIRDSISFNIMYEDILITGNHIVVYSSDECLVHVIGGMDKYKGPLEGGVLAMLPTGVNYRYVLVTNDSIQTVELK